jgi:hypothetical protein
MQKRKYQRAKAIVATQFSVLHESLIHVQETQSAFQPRAQRNAFRRHGARQQSRLFALRNPPLKPSQTPSGFSEIVSDYFPVLHAVAIASFGPLYYFI